jgi:hypothetical protein
VWSLQRRNTTCLVEILSSCVSFNNLRAMPLPDIEPSQKVVGVHRESAVGLLLQLLAAMKPALLAADREWQNVAANEAPTFRALSLVNPDENRVSDIIAELLNPYGSHGQNTTFLTLFASRCGAVGKRPLHHVSIHRESCTIFIANQRRRIDLLLDGGTWGVGIENKPWAGEQKGQLQDYADDLEKRFGENFLLIRLTGRDVEAKSLDAQRQEQLSAQGKFASWRYDTDLLAWVNECRQRCQAPRVASFLEELSRYIAAEFVTVPNPRTDMERKHLLPALESILEKDPSQLHSAAAIAELFPVLRQKMVSHLFDEVQKDVLAVLASDWSVERSDENFVETDWAVFGFAHKDWRGLYQVRLESQPKFSLVVLGVWHDKDKGVQRSELVQRDLKRLGWGKKGGGPYWDGHSPLPEPFTNWTTGSGIAAVVKQRAEIRTLLTEGFVKLCTHFKNPLARLAKTGPPQL